MEGFTLYPWWKIFYFFYISKIHGMAVKAETLPMVPKESHHRSGWGSLHYGKARVRLDQVLMRADIICTGGMSRHLKENKFWCKEGLSSVLPLLHFSFKHQFLWLGTSDPICCPWDNSPALHLHATTILQATPHVLFLFIKMYLFCVPFYQCAFHARPHELWLGHHCC